MKFERSHLFFGCDIMNYFIFSLFLLLLFDSPQGSTVAHRRSIRALNTTLETDFDGTYERRNPCTNAEVEKSSYKASHEFRHYSKESNWSEYSRKCTEIISGFLSAIGNLVRFNSEQKGIFNFHINTSISQKQDRHSDPCHETSCPSLPTIIIEATDDDISQNAALKNLPLERPIVKQSNCSITGYSGNGVSEIRQRVCPNQREDGQESTCKPMPVNSLENEPEVSTFYPTAPEPQPESISIYSQDTSDTDQRAPVRQRQAMLNQGESIAISGAPQIPSSPLLVTFPGIAQSEVISPAAFTDTQKYPSQPGFYGTPTRPEYSTENYDASTVTTQPRNEIGIPNIESSPTETLNLENQFQPGPAYVEKSDDFNSSPIPSTTFGQFNDGPTVNIQGTTENVPFYQSDEPRATTGEDQLLTNQSGQQPTNVIPEQQFGDSLGGQESNSQPLVTSFTPADQFPTTALFPEQPLTRPNVEDVKTFEQEITPEPNPSPELADLPPTETPSVQEPIRINQPNFLPNSANSLFLPLPNSVQTVRLNQPSPLLVPQPQQPQNNLLNTDSQFVPENQATTPDQITTVNSEYDELSNQRLVTQPPQGEDTFPNTEAKSPFDGVASPFIQLSPVQLGKAPAVVPYNSFTFTPQSDISNGQPSIIGQSLSDNQASDPTAFAPGQSYPPSLLPEGQDSSFETQQATPSYDTEPILNNTPVENTAEELPANPEFTSPTVPDAVIPANSQFGYSDPTFNPTQESTTSYDNPAIQATTGPEVQPPQSFPPTAVGFQFQSSPNYGQFQPTITTTYANETITTDTNSKEPFGQFVSTLPAEQPPVGIYGIEQPQFTIVGPYEEPQIQAKAVPQLGLGDEFAKNEMSGSPVSDFNRQQTPSFVQPGTQTEENAPFSQFPSNYSPEQQPVENYNIIENQTTSEESFEDSLPRTTDAPVFSVDNGITTSSPDLYNQQTPNTFTDSQVGGNTPLDQFPPNFPVQQPVGNYEAPDPQIVAPGSSENLELQTKEDPKFLPPVEPAPTFYDQQNPIETNVPFEQLPTTTSPEQQFTENPETEVESIDDTQRQTMGSEFQFPLQNENNRISTLPISVVYGRQIPMRFLPSELQLGGKAPLGQFPSTQFTEQPPEDNSEFMQSEPIPAAEYEDSKLETPMGPESQLASVNSENGTTGLPDPGSYNFESPNTFTQPDSQLEGNAPFNQFPSREVQIESTITQSETTIVPSRDNDSRLSQLPTLEGNQETPTVPEWQQPVENDQMAQQSTPAQIYEDSGMQTTISSELQPVPEYEGGVPNSFVQPESQFGGSPLSNQFPGNLPPEQSLIGDSEMNQGQTTSPDQPHTIAQPDSLPSQEYGSDRMNGLRAFYNQQYPSTSIIPNAQLIGSIGFPATFSPEQQPVENNDLTQPQLTSARTNENENTVPQFPTNEEPQPSPGYTNQYLNNGESEVPAFGVTNQQIPITFSETEAEVSSDASFDRFPSTFSTEPQSTSGLSYEDSQMQGTVRPDFQSPPEYTDDRRNVSPVPNNEQNARTSILSDSQLQDSQLFNQIQPESQLKNKEPSTTTPEEQLFENEQISQSTPISVATSEDSRLQATTASEPQTPFFYSNEKTGLPNFNFNNQQIPAAFVPIESQVINNIPFNQFPPTFPQRQQPVGIYETEQSQSTTVPSNEEYQEQATAAPQTESVTQYSNDQPTGLSDQKVPDAFVQPIPQVTDNSPFSQFPSTLPPEEEAMGNYETPQPLNSAVSTYEDQTTVTEFQTTPAPKEQPVENYANGIRAGLPIPGFINQQIPNTFVPGIPTNTGFRGPPAAQQENQADGAIYSEESSEMEDTTSPTLAAQPETFPSTLEISNEQASSANIQPIVSQNDFQGAMNPTLADSDQNSSFPPQTQFEDPSFTSRPTEPQFNNQRDLISSTETLPDVPVAALAPGKEYFGNPEQTFKTSPLDTSVGYQDQPMPSSTFVSPYQGQVLNDDMTTTIPLNSEQTAPVTDADSPANIYVSDPRETVNPTGEYGNSLYTNAENPLFVNPNLPYGYTPNVKPYFGDEQPQMTASTDPSVSSRDQFPANDYPSGSDPVYDQISNGNADESQPESGMLEQTSDVYQPNAPVDVPSQPAQFPEDGQSVPQEIPAADQYNIDSSTDLSTSDTSLYALQPTYINSQPIPLMPEAGPEAAFPLPNESDGRPSIADSNVGDDSSQIQRKFSPRPILLYGNGNPSLADPETTLSPSITKYPEDDSESHFEQFSPEDSSTFTPPDKIPSDFENPVTELQATPESTMLEEQAIPNSFPKETQNQSPQDVNQYSGNPNQLFAGPLNPIAFKTPNIYSKFPPQPLNPSFQENQNLQPPFYSNPIPSQASNLEEQVVPAFPENENQPSSTLAEISEPQWKVPENPQPVEQLHNVEQTEEVKDTMFSKQPSTAYPMMYPPGNDVQPVIPYQPPAASEPLPNFEATEFPSEQQGTPLNNFNAPINSAENQRTDTFEQAAEKPEDLNHMSPFSTGESLSEQQMTPYSNDWDPNSVQTLPEYDSNVSYGSAQPRTELESESLISTAGNDQPLPGTFQPSYVPESQTETTLPYSNGPSVGFTPSFAESENVLFSSPSPTTEIQTSTESEETSTFYNAPSVAPGNPPASGPSNFATVVPPTFQSEPERVDDSLVLQPVSNLNQFPLAVSSNPTVPMFPQAPIYDENSLATTDNPSLPFDSTSVSETSSDPYTVNPNASDPRDKTGTQGTEGYQTLAPISGSNIPLYNAEQTPLAVAEATPSPEAQFSSPYYGETVQPTLNSWNAPEVMPEPQPQPSLDNANEIQDYKTEDGMDQTSTTFYNTSPPQLNPEAFRTSGPNPTNTFQPERQTPSAYNPDGMNTDGDYQLQDTPTSQSFGEESNANLNAPTTTVRYSSDDIYTTDNARRNPDQDVGLQTDYGTTLPNQAFLTSPVKAPIRFDIPLLQYEPQPNQEAPELTDNVSPQIQSTTTNYDEETNTYQSSPAPQPQTTLSNVDQFSDDNVASISPDELENASPKFELMPAFVSQRTNPEFPDRNTQFQPQSQLTEGNPVIYDNQQPPPTVFEPSIVTETVKSDISFSNQPDNYYSGMETNEGVPGQLEPETSPNPPETLNQRVEPESTEYAGEKLDSGVTDHPDDFTSFSPPTEKPFQTEVPVTEYDVITEETTHFPSNYQPQLFDTQNQPVDTPMYNGQPTDPQENIATEFSGVTNPSYKTQLTNTDYINNNDELEPVPRDTTLPPQDSSTIIPESSLYSDSSVYNVRRRPNGRLFDISTLPQSEGNNDEQVEYSPALTPNNFADQPLVLDDTTTPVDYDLSTQSPEAAVTQDDEGIQGNQNYVPAMRQPFDNPTEQPGLYNSQLGVPVQPQTDSPLDFEEGSARRPVTFTPNSESFANPSPPMQEEPNFNPLFQTLESHLIVPLPEPQPSTASSPFQEPLYLDPREASPIPNDSFSFDQSNQNRFSTIPPNFRRPDFDQNFVTSQPQPNAGDVMNTPQSDSQALVSDLTTPSNKPGEDCVSCSYKGSYPIMCPFDPILKGNMTAPSYYILITKLPAQDNKEDHFRVEKVYLGDGTPLNCSFSAGKTFPTSLYTPVQLRSTGTVKLRTKRST